MPGGQPFVVGTVDPVPDGQKKPAGQGTWAVLVDTAAHRYPAEQRLLEAVELPRPRQAPAAHESAPVTVVLTAEKEALTVYVPTPPVPVPRPTMVTPAGIVPPEIFMPTRSAPEVTAVTVRVVDATEPVTTGSVAPLSEADEMAAAGATLIVHVHGTFALAHAPPTMEVTVVPATMLVPESTIPTRSELDATADTVSVFELAATEPVNDAPRKDGAEPKPWGQKKPAGQE